MTMSPLSNMLHFAISPALLIVLDVLLLLPLRSCFCAVENPGCSEFSARR